MNADAKRAAVKFTACALIALFIVIAIVAVWPAGFIKPMLYVAAGGTCIALIWPSQDEGDAIIKSIQK